jgi:hypothetical protein
VGKQNRKSIDDRVAKTAARAENMRGFQPGLELKRGVADGADEVLEVFLGE